MKSTERAQARVRCEWAQDPLNIHYHDEEWGEPVHEDRKLFEFLILEGAQAGLSWTTILKKREGYRLAFQQFDPHLVACMTDADVERLMQNPNIVRNRLKIRSAMLNARAFLAVQKEFGSFDRYIWQFVGGNPIITVRRSLKDLPAQTAESEAMSKDLKKRGFRFVGPTICYAFMQACGLVSDHTQVCYKSAPSAHESKPYRPVESES